MRVELFSPSSNYYLYSARLHCLHITRVKVSESNLHSEHDRTYYHVFLISTSLLVQTISAFHKYFVIWLEQLQLVIKSTEYI